MQVSAAKSRFGNLNKQADVELTVDLIEKQLPVNRQAQMGYSDIGRRISNLKRRKSQSK